VTAYWFTGNTLDVLAEMPDNSVDLVMTSPPFLALRSYLPDGDPAKVHEIGQEPTPGEFIDALLDITEELRRVVAPHGSICVELGDTYAGSGGAGGDYADDGLRAGQPKFRAGTPRWDGRPEGQVRTTTSDPAEIMVTGKSGGPGWPQDKSLTLIPELYRMALAYGINPLTGRTTPRWRIRNVIRWVRPNPPVGALGDKFRPGTSEMVIATGTDEAGRARYFDLDAVRTPTSGQTRDDVGVKRRHTMDGGEMGAYTAEMSAAGAPPLDWWEIPTKGYAGSHYATFPPALCERPVKAMCPLKVCTTCGEPSRRITEPTEEYAAAAARMQDVISDERNGSNETNPKRLIRGQSGVKAAGVETVPYGNQTVGWTDCGHNTWRTGITLDPFGGSGTTLMVATGHGRDAIGIDLDKRNVELARERIGPMFFEESTPADLWPLDGAA
jgi:hypothetical protein